MNQKDEIEEAFAKKRYGPAYMLGFSAVYLGGFGLLWYQTNWKVAIAVFLICYGVLLQCHMAFATRITKPNQ